MTEQPARVRMLRIAIIPTGVFNLLAPCVLVRFTPISFTVFMFLGEMLCVVAVVLLLGSVLADLRAKQLLEPPPASRRSAAPDAYRLHHGVARSRKLMQMDHCQRRLAFFTIRPVSAGVVWS